MIILPPSPAKTDHLIPGTSACARTHRDMSCLVVICAISVTPVITASLLSGSAKPALRGHGERQTSHMALRQGGGASCRRARCGSVYRLISLEADPACYEPL